MEIKPTDMGISYENNSVKSLKTIFFVSDKTPLQYFQIQDIETYEQQDIALGMDRYYIEKNDQGFGGYGGILKIEINQGYLRFDLDEVGKKNLQEDYIEVIWNGDEPIFHQVQKALKKLIEKYSI